MQVCRLLVGESEDPVALLQAALKVASERVVVKRHHAAPPIAPSPSFDVSAERVRFDVYLTAPTPR